MVRNTKCSTRASHISKSPLVYVESTDSFSRYNATIAIVEGFALIVSCKESSVPVLVATAGEAMARRSVEGTIGECNGGGVGEACGDRNFRTR